MRTRLHVPLRRQRPRGLTPRANRVVRLARRIARCRGDGFVGTEHLFLALLAEGGSPPALVLGDLRVAAEAQERVEAVLEAYKSRPNGTAGRGAG